jgi:hypothetical protein
LKSALRSLVPHHPVLSFLSYDGFSKKTLHFKSFTDLRVKEFDGIYNNEIIKRSEKQDINWLPYKRQENRKRKYGAGRHFKLDVKNRFLILLVYYRLYITYTLAGF